MKAKNIVRAWDITHKKLLFKKEITYARNLKDGVYSVKILNPEEHAALVWTRLGGERLHRLYSTLGKQLSLQELSALLVLEYENQHKLPFSPAALEIAQNSENNLLKKIYDTRYNSVAAQDELECAATECNKRAIELHLKM
ncbi:MAG: hypothetical protein AMXMBFR12_07350 [Candidatus Babeliales bacterium]